MLDSQKFETAPDGAAEQRDMMSEQAMVRDFHKAFIHPIAEAPTMLNPERVRARAGWMREEVEEFENAETLDQQVDAMIDLMYFALGTMVELGVDAAPVFEIVHKANMKKLGPDGKPRFRPGDGKVQKPADWIDPRILVAAEVQRQTIQSAAAARPLSATG